MKTIIEDLDELDDIIKKVDEGETVVNSETVKVTKKESNRAFWTTIIIAFAIWLLSCLAGIVILGMWIDGAL